MQFIKATDAETGKEVLINIEDVSFMQEEEDYTAVWFISDPEIHVAITEKPSAALEQLLFVDTERL